MQRCVYPTPSLPASVSAVSVLFPWKFRGGEGWITLEIIDIRAREKLSKIRISGSLTVNGA